MSGFCNFDYGTSGFCESCASIGSGECENSGFNNDRGKTECQRICEGKSNTKSKDNIKSFKMLKVIIKKAIMIFLFHIHF